MAVNQVVEKEIADLIHPNSTLGINVRLKKVLEALQDCGFLYTNMVAPASFLCHPQNRGGSMINGHNAHKKGSEIYQAGVKKDLLEANSLAVEISLDPQVREKQLAANRRMTSDAKGLLADVKGDEGFLTLANSHFIQWAKAINAGCKDPDGSQLVATPDLKPLLEHGWQWKVIRAEAEKIWPRLPAFAAMAMNASNSVQVASNELECMLQLADLFGAGLTMDEAVLQVEHSAPQCKSYLKDVSYFCKMFGGGTGFPLLQCLDQFCTWSAFVQILYKLEPLPNP